MVKKIDSAKAAVQFCVDNGVTVKFQDDGSVKGSYYRPDGLGAVRAGQDNKMDFVDFVNALANTEKSQDDVRDEEERLEAERIVAEEAAIAEVEAAVANFEPVKGMAVVDELDDGETVIIDAEDNGGDE